MANVTDAAETNLIKAAQMSKAREVDLVYRFTHSSLAKLIEVLGITRKIPMMEGTTMYVYTTSGTLENGAVDEGKIIPLSQYTRNKTAVGNITLKKWRKAASAEAIKKSGYDEAVRQTDAKMISDVQAGIRTDFFSFINGSIANSTSVSKSGLQAALAEAWGQLQVKFEDDTAEAVYFLNPLDVADYLGAAQVTMQTAFGLNYIENFLGLGTVILSSRITQGTFVATAKENLILYYLTMNGDLARAFDLTADELGYIGIKSGYQNEERAQIESLVMSGIQILVEYAQGVVKGVINDVLPRLNVYSVAGASSGKTAITYDGYEKGASDVLKYKVTDDVIVVEAGQDVSGWTTWDGSADITAATNKILTLAVADSNTKVLAAGHATVTAKA